MSSPPGPATPPPSVPPGAPRGRRAGAPPSAPRGDAASASLGATRGAAPHPGLRLSAGALVGLEAVALLLLGGWIVVAGFVGKPASWVYVGWMAALALATGVALLLVARGVAAGRPWSRAPAVLTQMLVIVVLYEPLQAVPAVRWLVLGLAALILVLLVASGLIRPGGRTG